MALESGDSLSKYRLFFQVTLTSLERLLQSSVVRPSSRLPSITAGDVLLRWAVDYGQDVLMPQFRKRHALCVLNIPLPHAVLLAKSKWESYAFPLSRDGRKQRGLHVSLVKPLWERFRGSEMQGAECASETEDATEFSIEKLQHICDYLLPVTTSVPRHHGVCHGLRHDS